MMHPIRIKLFEKYKLQKYRYVEGGLRRTTFE